MKIRERDAQILIHILKYAQFIDLTIKRFGNDENIFANDYDYRNSISMSIMQIGELAKKLTHEFRNESSSVPWSKIAGMRNLFAHEYENMTLHIIWESATESVPELERECRKILRESDIALPDEC